MSARRGHSLSSQTCGHFPCSSRSHQPLPFPPAGIPEFLKTKKEIGLSACSRAHLDFRWRFCLFESVVAIGKFVDDLSAIPEKEFTHLSVLDFLRRNRVDLASLSPYLYFSRDHYTRNLIQRTPLFDLLAICWEPGQQSPIHNHCNQNCWMAMACGRVQVHNFKLIQKDPATGFCDLESSTHYLIDAGNPQEVDPGEPIHRVANPRSFMSRAVTLHVYSKPYDTCEVYDLKEKRYQEVQLVNTTEYGVVKSDTRLEKAAVEALM